MLTRSNHVLLQDKTKTYKDMWKHRLTLAHTPYPERDFSVETMQLSRVRVW